MKTRLPLIVTAMFIAIGAVACGGTYDLDESEDGVIQDDYSDEQTKKGEIKPGLEAQGGFWGDGYHEEEVDEDP